MVSVQFRKNLQGRHFVVGGPKNFKEKKTLPDVSFDYDFQKIILSSLLLFRVFVINSI